MAMRLTTSKLLGLIVGLTIFGAVVALAVPRIRSFIRPDITDPAVLARMPLAKLRDSEIETLVCAAFRHADEVTVRSEGRPNNRSRRVLITDRATLDRLAGLFVLKADNGRLPLYRHPGVMYTQVEFNGPYAPNFVFTSAKEILIYSGPIRPVSTQFAQALADELALPLADPQ